MRAVGIASSLEHLKLLMEAGGGAAADPAMRLLLQHPSVVRPQGRQQLILLA